MVEKNNAMEYILLTSHSDLDQDFNVIVRQAHPRLLPKEHVYIYKTNQENLSRVIILVGH